MIIITGAAGFIGSALAWHFNQKNITDLILVDDFKTSDKWKNWVGLKFKECWGKDAFLHTIKTDTFPYSKSHIKAIYHMGACSSTTEQDGSYLMENNYRYSQLLAKWAISNQIRFVYASSAATYGNGEEGFQDNESKLELLRPINRYGYSKHAFDLWLKNENLLGKVAGLKFFNVFGPNEYHKGDMKSLICKSYGQILETKKMRLFKSYHPDYADGGQMRDFVYVKDILSVMAWMLDAKFPGGIYNLGSGQAHSWNELAYAMADALNTRIQIEYFEMPEALKKQYQYYTEADISKLRKAGYSQPMTSLNEAVHDYVTGYLTQGEKTLAF